MSRREHAGEVHFGNDSFLDVLANMVGILIILVVIAGARAGKKSLDDAAAEKAAAKAAETAAATPVPVQIVTSPPPVAALPLPAPKEKEPEEPEVITPEPAEALPVAQEEIRQDLDSAPGVRSPNATPRIEESEEPPRELVARLEDLRRETQSLEQLTEAEKQALEAAKANEQKSQVQLAGIHEEVTAAGQELQSARERLEELQKLLKRDWTQYSGLLAETETAKHAKGPVKQVQHRLTPVSKVVSGEELHFRIENGKVAYVPLDELVERVKMQMVKQKEWMVNFRRHQGTVGPIDGFRMEYVVERQGLSVVDEARNGSGRGMVRVGVSSWQIQPEDDLESESVEEALRPGSKFARRLQQAKAESALTFWVYPESFPAFRKLQAAAHSAGFTVSGRPLPTGLPIAGSPQGSRSAGQ